jgi:membrane protein implicated in regulation of membrane protease activity
MTAIDRKWIALGAIAAGTYVVTLVAAGYYATQGAAFAALCVAVVLGSVMWLGETVSSKMNWSVGSAQNSKPD